MYGFWYDYVITKLCCTDTDIVIVYIKANNIQKDNVEDVETRFGTSNYELERPLPRGKNKNITGLMRDK